MLIIPYSQLNNCSLASWTLAIKRKLNTNDTKATIKILARIFNYWSFILHLSMTENPTQSSLAEDAFWDVKLKPYSYVRTYILLSMTVYNVVPGRDWRVFEWDLTVTQFHQSILWSQKLWYGAVGALAFKPRSNEDASRCKLMRVASLACVWPPTRINSHQLASTCINLHRLWAVSNFDASTCKSTRVFARLTGHESCCMRVVDKFWTASGFYFVATGSTKLLSVFLVNFRSTLIDSHATLVLVWPSNHASPCKSMQTLVCQLASTRILVWPGLY